MFSQVRGQAQPGEDVRVPEPPMRLRHLQRKGSNPVPLVLLPALKPPAPVELPQTYILASWQLSNDLRAKVLRRESKNKLIKISWLSGTRMNV